MRLGFLAAVIFGLAGTGVLAGLGAWQLQRLEWKEALIAELEARLSAGPAPLPADPDPEADNFLRVAVAGELGAEALHVLTSERPWGPGFRVIAPLTTGEGRTVLVDLGYVPEAMKGEAMKGEAVPGGARAEVTGALFWPRERDSFTPAPDRAENIWFARDPEKMAEALGAEPVLIVADAHDLGAHDLGAHDLGAHDLGAHDLGAHDLGEWPRPLPLGVNLRNDHLGYAVTWFALAAIWAVMSVLLARRERRRGRA